MREPRRNDFGQPIGEALPEWDAPPRPEVEELVGTSVRLVPLAVAHAADLYAACCQPGDEARWTYIPAGPFDSPEQVAAYVMALSSQPDRRPLAILDAATGRCLGTASYLRIDPPVGTIEVGAITYGPDLAQTRGATEAMYLMARHVFDLGYRRYEWKCDALNAPSRRAAERLGFTFEGVWRQAMVYKGRNRDTAWFGMTDGDWQRLRPEYDAWLAESAPDGVQRSSLSARTAAALRQSRDSTAP